MSVSCVAAAVLGHRMDIVCDDVIDRRICRNAPGAHVQPFAKGRGSVKLNVLLDSQTFIGTGVCVLCVCVCVYTCVRRGGVCDGTACFAEISTAWGDRLWMKQPQGLPRAAQLSFVFISFCFARSSVCVSFSASMLSISDPRQTPRRILTLIPTTAGCPQSRTHGSSCVAQAWFAALDLSPARPLL